MTVGRGARRPRHCLPFRTNKALLRPAIPLRSIAAGQLFVKAADALLTEVGS